MRSIIKTQLRTGAGAHGIPAKTDNCPVHNRTTNFLVGFMVMEQFQKLHSFSHSTGKTSLARVLLLGLIVMGFSAPAMAIAPTEFSTNGTKVTFTGRDYNSANDKTYFHYQVTRGLLDRPLESLKFTLPNSATSSALTNVFTTLPFLRTIDPSVGQDSLLFTKSSSALPVSNIDLAFLGNVPSGTIDLTAKSSPTDTLLSGTIIGPTISGLGINPPNLNPTDNPTCILDTAQPIIANVNQPLSIPLKIGGSSASEMTMKYDHWPAGASSSVPSGGTVNSGETVLINWVPTSAEAGSIQTLPITVASGLTNIVCDLSINVIQNLPPVIDIASLPTTIQCQGLTTVVPLDASGSFDPEGLPLQYTWDHNCQGASLLNSNTARTSIALTAPGAGGTQTCTATVTASDGKNITSKIINLNANACDVNCDASQKDQCGVCNGNNLCVDCNGQAFGGKTTDRCGVCGGTNACVDCGGTPNGSAQQDLCGTCGGDSSACRDCTDVDLQSVLAKLDGTALSQAKIVNRPLRNLKKTPAKRAATNLMAKANKLYTQSWVLVWSLNRNNAVCSHYEGCQSASSSDAMNQYVSNAAKLKRIVLKAAALIRKNGGPNAKHQAASLRRAARGKLFDADSLTKNYPAITHSCQ